MIHRVGPRAFVAMMTLVVSFHPVCALVFGCQCSAIFWGGHQTCIFAPWLMPLPSSLCPWCAMSLATLGSMTVMVLVAVVVLTWRLGEYGAWALYGAIVSTSVSVLFMMGIVTAFADGFAAGGISYWMNEACGSLTTR